MSKVCIDSNTFFIFGFVAFVFVYYVTQIKPQKCTKCSPCEPCLDCPKCPKPRDCNKSRECPPCPIVQEIPSIDKARIYDPTLEPERSYIPNMSRSSYTGPGLPINIKTRGNYNRSQKVGTVFQEGRGHLALYEKPSDYHSDRYEYYVIDNTRNRNKIPVGDKKNNQLNTGDHIHVPGFGKFNVNKYDIDEPRYIPYV